MDENTLGGGPQTPQVAEEKSHVMGYILTALIALIIGGGIGYVGAVMLQENDDIEEEAADLEEPISGTLPGSQPADSSPTTSTSILFATQGLPTLSEGVYEGWAMFTGEAPVSIGTFSGGASVTLSSDRDLSLADRIVVTIEPSNDPDPTPSEIVVLTGVLENGAATLTFPIDLSTIAGSYVLGTPTDGSDVTNENSGVWFLEVGQPNTASLVLPTLPTGWVYEGWAVVAGTPLTSGRFTLATGQDSFNGFSGTAKAGPPFPGEDYLQNAPSGLTFPLDLGNGSSRIAITVEPDIAGVDPTGAGPYPIDVLEADVPAGATDHVSYNLVYNGAAIPSGTATVQ